MGWPSMREDILSRFEENNQHYDKLIRHAFSENNEQRITILLSRFLDCQEEFRKEIMSLLDLVSSPNIDLAAENLKLKQVGEQKDHQIALMSTQLTIANKDNKGKVKEIERHMDSAVHSLRQQREKASIHKNEVRDLLSKVDALKQHCRNLEAELIQAEATHATYEQFIKVEITRGSISAESAMLALYEIQRGATSRD